MNSFMKVCVFLVFAACAVNTALSDDVVSSYADAFDKYQIKFNKHYDSKEEYDKRLRIYAESMEKIKKLNARGDDTATYGETSLSDMSKEEFRMLNQAHTIPVPEEESRKRQKGEDNTFPKPKLAESHELHNMPTEFSWFNISGVKHPARSQGDCGSCWAFAAAGALEMQAVLEGHKFYNISVEQCLDCGSDGMATGTGGCCGGYPGYSYEKVKRYVTEEDYPYLLSKWAIPAACSPYSCKSFSKSQAVYEIRGYDPLFPMNPAVLKEQIWMYGPIGIYMDAVYEMAQYTGGILDCTGKTSAGGHYVVAVGYGPNYIALRNSWGPSWGLEGDFLISDKNSEASCKMTVDITGSVRKYQMARVSVVPAASYKIVPTIAIAMMVLFFFMF